MSWMIVYQMGMVFSVSFVFDSGMLIWFLRGCLFGRGLGEPGACVRIMESSNGNIFRVTGHLCGEFTGHRWIPRTKAGDAEIWTVE